MEPVRRFLVRRTDWATADDVLADTLLVIWRRLDDVPSDNPLPWAYTVARNCLSNAERTDRRQQRVVDKAARLPAHREDNATASTDVGLERALATLTATEAELIRLWAWEQLTPTEIAQVLDITSNAVNIRLHRARQKLAESLRKADVSAGHKESKGGRYE